MSLCEKLHLAGFKSPKAIIGRKVQGVSKVQIGAKGCDVLRGAARNGLPQRSSRFMQPTNLAGKTHGSLELSARGSLARWSANAL